MDNLLSTKANQNVLKTCRHFDILPKTFYKWYGRFQDGKNFPGLEEKSRAPKRKREREITPLEDQRIIELRKKKIRWSPPKLKPLSEVKSKEGISCWKIRKVIELRNIDSISIH